MKLHTKKPEVDVDVKPFATTYKMDFDDPKYKTSPIQRTLKKAQSVQRFTSPPKQQMYEAVLGGQPTRMNPGLMLEARKTSLYYDKHNPRQEGGTGNL